MGDNVYPCLIEKSCISLNNGGRIPVTFTIFVKINIVKVLEQNKDLIKQSLQVCGSDFLENDDFSGNL